MVTSTGKILSIIYRKLYRSFGPQHWWPATPPKRGGEARPFRKPIRGRPADPFEVIVGAILTQNTSWRNVEKAIDHLKKEKLLTPAALHQLPHQKLAALIKPAGFFNIKAKRLKNFLDFLFSRYNGRLGSMACVESGRLRQELLAINGIGPETADSILLYAFDKPVFVVDAYTKRIFSRHKIIGHAETYDQIQARFMSRLKRDKSLYNEYHALIVQCAKTFCRTQPHCSGCPLEFLNKNKIFRGYAYAGQ